MILSGIHDGFPVGFHQVMRNPGFAQQFSVFLYIEVITVDLHRATQEEAIRTQDIVVLEDIEEGIRVKLALYLLKKYYI